MSKDPELKGFTSSCGRKPLRYRRARNLSMKYWPMSYPNEMFYIAEVFFSISSKWEYPTYCHIVPHKRYWQESAKGILKEKGDLELYMEIIRSFPLKNTILFNQLIEKYNIIAPLLEQDKVKEAGITLFEYEKRKALERKDQDPGLRYACHFPNKAIILYLPKDLERSWKKAAIIAYNYALNHKDTSPEFRELLIKKAGWLVNE